MKPTFTFCSRLSRPLGLCVLAAAAAMASGAAVAQWQWKDATGRPVFSDRPPPPSVAEKDILKRPGERTAAAQAASPAASGDAASTAGPPGAAPTASPTNPAAPAVPALADTQLEARKKQLEKAEADRRAAEAKAADEKAAKVRAANCEAARRNKASLDSGARLTVPNAKGETEYLDEAGRATQLRRVEEVMRENCR